MRSHGFTEVGRSITLLLVLAAAAGCGRRDARASIPHEAGDASPVPEAAALRMQASAPAELASPTAAAPASVAPVAGGQGSGPLVDPVSYLAYESSIHLELPGEQLIRTMDGHAAACRDAGPRVCQLTQAQRQGDPRSDLTGSLLLRGEPQWLQRFMAGVENDTRSAGGTVTAKSTTTEDLTRAIIDTEATLRAKKSLRSRLEALLASRPGRLSDLLEVERELARVQGEIDSTESNLAAMRTRVMMSALTLQYQSEARAVAGDTFQPLSHAFAGFIGYVVDGAAAIVTLVAVALPWVVVGAPMVWLVLRAHRRRRDARRAAAVQPAATAEPPATPAL